MRGKITVAPILGSYLKKVHPARFENVPFLRVDFLGASVYTDHARGAVV